MSCLPPVAPVLVPHTCVGEPKMLHHPVRKRSEARFCTGEVGPVHGSPAQEEEPSSYKWRLLISYDGTKYAGWQLRQKSVTMQLMLQEALTRVAKLSKKTSGSKSYRHRCSCLGPGECEGEEVDIAVDFQQLASEKEEAKAIMMQFLKSLGLSTALSNQVTKKGGQFIIHLLSILHTRYRVRYVTGRELTTAEIQGTLLPYLEALAAEHGDGLVDVLVYFPDPPPLRKEYHGNGVPSIGRSLATRDGSGNCGLTLNGNFRPSVSYALSLGLSLQQVQVLANRVPSFVSYSPERKIKPVVNYFLALGVTKPGIVKVFLKRPQIFGCSLEGNLKPTMAYLESIGVERSQWSRILVQFPALLTYGEAKLQEAVAFLREAGIPSTDVGSIISRFPHVVSYSVEEKLSPMLEFLTSIGVKDVGLFLRRSPQVLGYSVDGNIKPTIRFLIELGYNQMEVITIINRFPQILGLAINSNIKPKWDYYAEIGWPKSYLVTFPQYFGYSLKARIKPRFEEVLRHGFCWTPSRILSSSSKEFERLLRDHVEEALISSSVCQPTVASSSILCDNA